jgi:hypothetical protein
MKINANKEKRGSIGVNSSKRPTIVNTPQMWAALEKAKLTLPV